MSSSANERTSAMLATASQLGLSFDSDVVHTWKDVAGARSIPLFSVTLTRTGARLSLQGPWPDRDGSLSPDPNRVAVLWEADVQMRGLAHARVNASPDGAPRAAVDGLPIDLISAPLGWAAEAADALPAADGAAFLTAVGRSLEQATRHLRSLAVGPAIDAARAFSRRGGMRWFVYEAVANDPTGRLARLAIRCPGVLILCKGLVDHGAAAAARKVLTAAARGAGLTRLLRMACAAWAEVQHGQRPLLGLTAPGRVRISPDQLAAQLRRVRVASDQVDPRQLWSVPARLGASFESDPGATLAQPGPSESRAPRGHDQTDDGDGALYLFPTAAVA